MPGGKNYCFGLYHKRQQIGFTAFSNYVPGKRILHFNRTVILPEYQGAKLGGEFINITSEHMASQKFKIMAKFTNQAVARSLIKKKEWVLAKISTNWQKNLRMAGGNMINKTGHRVNVKSYLFTYKPIKQRENTDA